MHIFTNTVTNVLGQNAIAVANFLTFELDIALNSIAHLIEVLRLGQPRDSSPQRAFGNPGELFTFSNQFWAIRVWNNNRDGAIAIPSLELSTGINRDNVTWFEDSSARNSVNNGIVNRGAHRMAVARNKFEVRFCSPGNNGGFGSSINL